MFKKISKFIKKHESLSIFALLLLVIFISYGKTINMYWWADDWGMLYKMIHPMEGAGNLGSGLWGGGAYRFLATPFIFLYPLFGANAQPYFILGLFQYSLAAFVVYLFVKELTQNKQIALGAALIFAFGYIGSFALYRLSNSYQLSDTTILVYLSALFLVKYLRNTKKKNYFLSLIFYMAALIFMFLRAHGIVVVIFSIFVFWIVTNWKKEKRKILNRIVLFLPFLVSYYYFYLYSFMSGSGSRGALTDTFLGKTINEIFVQKQYSLINNFFYGFSSIIIPNPWIYSFFAFLKKNIFIVSIYFRNGDPLVIFAGYILFALAWILPFVYKKYRQILMYLPLAALFIFGNVMMYWINAPTSQLESYNRYVMPSFVGSAIFYSCVFFVVSDIIAKSKKYKKKIFYLLLTILGISFISLSYHFQNEILEYISYPTQEAYKVIKKTVPAVDANTVFFIDTEDDPRVKNNVLSGMGELGISIFYGYAGTTKFAHTYEELFSQIRSKEIDLDNLYTFFASEKLGLVPTSEDFKKGLFKKLEPKAIDNWEYFDDPIHAYAPVDYSSLMPSQVRLSISYKPDEAVIGKVPIKIWWMTEKRSTYQLFYAQDIEIIPDGMMHSYTIYIPAGGLTVQSLWIDGYPAGKIKVLNSSIINLTLPELQGKNIINN